MFLQQKHQGQEITWPPKSSGILCVFTSKQRKSWKFPFIWLNCNNSPAWNKRTFRCFSPRTLQTIIYRGRLRLWSVRYCTWIDKQMIIYPLIVCNYYLSLNTTMISKLTKLLIILNQKSMITINNSRITIFWGFQDQCIINSNNNRYPSVNQHTYIEQSHYAKSKSSTSG